MNFVPRKRINDQFVDALQTPGKQLIVYGESGSGKSTLLQRKLEETYEGHITSRCVNSMTFDQLLLDAFDQLDPYYLSGSTTSLTHKSSSDLTADFLRIRASLSASNETTNARATARFLPPQLTPQRLGLFLGAQHLCWVIEDFHKIRSEEKLPLAQSLKVFSDLASEYPEAKIIAVGATDTAREVVEYDPEMSHRVSELLVPLMEPDELAEIIVNGQRLLNLDMTELLEDIVQYSMGLGSVCHQLALNACLEANVVATETVKRKLPRASALTPAVERYVRESSDTLKGNFDKALVRHRRRRYDNQRLILAALATGPIEGMYRQDLFSKIREEESTYPVSNLTFYLQELIGPERGSIIRKGTDGRYRFVDPLHHSFAQALLIPPGQRSQQALRGIGEIVVGTVTRLATDHLTATWIADEEMIRITDTDQYDVWWTNMPRALIRQLGAGESPTEVPPPDSPGSAPSNRLPSLPWREDDLARFLNSGTKTAHTVGTMLDVLVERPGEQFSTTDLVERLGVTRNELRGGLSAFTRHIHKHYGRTNWPFIFTWGPGLGKGYPTEAHYSVVNKDVITAWKKLRRVDQEL